MIQLWFRHPFLYVPEPLMITIVLINLPTTLAVSFIIYGMI